MSRVDLQSPNADTSSVIASWLKSLTPLSLLSLSSIASIGCEESEPPQQQASPTPPPEPAAPPPIESPPTLVISESGPAVRGSSVLLELETGVIADDRRAKLGQYLEEEEKFLRDHEVRIAVDRKAKPAWVAVFLSELSKLKPSSIVLATETRSEFSAEIPVVPEEMLDSPKPCSLVGTVTEDRGTAIWRVQGGTARKRGRGMGGPDLTMTGDTITDMARSCDSDLFFVTGSEGVEWGLVYDLGAAGLALEDVGLKRVVIPTQPATAGHALDL